MTWHNPTIEEIEFAVGFYEEQTKTALEALEALTGPNSPIPRDGSDKEWSDEVARNLTLLKLTMSGISNLFDPKYAQQQGKKDGR